MEIKITQTGLEAIKASACSFFMKIISVCPQVSLLAERILLVTIDGQMK